MTTLLACPRCDRHVRAGDAACPFCSASMQAEQPRGPFTAIVRGATLMAVSAMTVGTLAACYGAPPRAYEQPPEVPANEQAPAPSPPVSVYNDGEPAWRVPKPDATLPAPDATLPAPSNTPPPATAPVPPSNVPVAPPAPPKTP
jgi:hypothetical protein